MVQNARRKRKKTNLFHKKTCQKGGGPYERIIASRWRSLERKRPYSEKKESDGSPFKKKERQGPRRIFSTGLCKNLKKKIEEESGRANQFRSIHQFGRGVARCGTSKIDAGSRGTYTGRVEDPRRRCVRTEKVTRRQGCGPNSPICNEGNTSGTAKSYL